MTPPSTPDAEASAFHDLVELAAAELLALRTKAEHALRIGLLPDQIIDYARGQLSADQRMDIEHLLAKSPWGMGRVVALLKAKRRSDSIARILETRGPVNAAAWGVWTGHPAADLATLLDQIQP